MECLHSSSQHLCGILLQLLQLAAHRHQAEHICLTTCNTEQRDSSAPASIVPSRESCLLRCLGTFWQGAYSMVARYCEPRSEMKGRPFSAVLHRISSA